MVKLRDGQRSSSICHSASVSSCASSTTMCANGPASRSGSAVGQGVLVDERVAQVRRRAASTSPAVLGVVGGDAGRRRPRSICSRSAATAASRRRRRRDASGSPSRCRAASSSGRSETVQACGSARCSVRTSSGVEPRARTGAGRPAPSTGRRRGRSARAAATPGRGPSRSSALLAERPAEQVGRDVLVVVACRPGSSSSSSQTWSRASLCGVPGSGASNASAQSSALSQTSAHGVSTTMPSVGGSS